MKRLTVRQRELLDKLIKGSTSPNTLKAREMLAKPEVRIAFEVLLDQAGLTDEHLANKARQIINRKPLKSKNNNTGVKSSNQTSIDANILQAIRLIWQAKGKFVEKHEVKSDLHSMPEEQLDNIIEDGMKYIKTRKNKLDG